jgi:hypothetical protein
LILGFYFLDFQEEKRWYEIVDTKPVTVAMSRLPGNQLVCFCHGSQDVNSTDLLSHAVCKAVVVLEMDGGLSCVTRRICVWDLDRQVPSFTTFFCALLLILHIPLSILKVVAHYGGWASRDFDDSFACQPVIAME